ncbi:type I-E CRISPR-associated endoribonuclease Cas2, partial [Limosilactobacillus fermentum]
MIVIALSKVPASLRGDLTKWCQEIQTGIYVGRFSARIRDLLWERIQKNIGNGEATIVYTTNNELGYAFRSTGEDREVVNY